MNDFPCPRPRCTRAPARCERRRPRRLTAPPARASARRERERRETSASTESRAMQILTTVLSRKLRAARGSCLDACRPLPLSPLPLSPLPFGLGQVKYKDTACTSAFDLCLRMDGRDGGAKCGAVVAADGTVSLAKAGRAWASAGLSDGLSRPRRGPVPPLWPKYAPPCARRCGRR